MTRAWCLGVVLLAAVGAASCSEPSASWFPDASLGGPASWRCPGQPAIDSPSVPPPDADGGAAPDGEGACVPRVAPRGIAAFDDGGRMLNVRGVHLVDWDGMMANPSVTVTLRAPPDVAFPASAVVSADDPRLYFDLPSTVDAAGPRKKIQLTDAASAVAIKIGIFPDRDGADEEHVLTLSLDGDDPRVETIPIVVHDQDRNLPAFTSITLDTTFVTTGFLDDPAAREVVQQAADDWVYFLDDMRFDPVPAHDESTFIWRSDAYLTRTEVTNAAAYTGFLLYVYGIHSNALRSGGAGSDVGKPQKSEGQALLLARSGIVEIETQGNYDSLGWVVDLAPEHWWQSANLDQKTDLFAVMHHEIGHAHGFDAGAYARFPSGTGALLCSPELVAYAGHGLPVNEDDHFYITVDPASGFGAFGNEYGGIMPARRWIITRVDLLALEAIGYKPRPGLFGTWRDDRPDCP